MDKLEYRNIKLKKHNPCSKDILGIEVYAKKEEEKMSFTDKMFKYNYKIKLKENNFSEPPLAFELTVEANFRKGIKADFEKGKYVREEND